jgi:hypothetical protein
METETFFYYLGLISVIFFIVWFIVKLTHVQVKIVEGLTTKNISNQSAPNSKVIDNETTQVLDGLHLDKYRSNYEDIIINLEKWCNITLLSGIVDNQIDVSKAMSPENIQKIMALNEINKFKTTLVETMTYLDGQ